MSPGTFQLSDDHADVDVLLGDAIQKLKSGNVVEAFNALDLFWARLAVHIRAEHLHLFPAALAISENEPAALGTGSDVRDVIERLRGDHDFFMHELADAIKGMRSLDSGEKLAVMRDTATRLEAIKNKLSEHNSIEESQIYPLHNFLSAAESDRLEQLIAKELAKLPRRFTRSE